MLLAGLHNWNSKGLFQESSQGQFDCRWLMKAKMKMKWNDDHGTFWNDRRSQVLVTQSHEGLIGWLVPLWRKMELSCQITSACVPTLYGNLKQAAEKRRRYFEFIIAKPPNKRTSFSAWIWTKSSCWFSAVFVEESNDYFQFLKFHKDRPRGPSTKSFKCMCHIDPVALAV